MACSEDAWNWYNPVNKTLINLQEESSAMNNFNLRTFLYIRPAEKLAVAQAAISEAIRTTAEFDDMSPVVRTGDRSGQLIIEFEFHAQDADQAEERADIALDELMHLVKNHEEAKDAYSGSDRLAYA